ALKLELAGMRGVRSDAASAPRRPGLRRLGAQPAEHPFEARGLAGVRAKHRRRLAVRVDAAELLVEDDAVVRTQHIDQRAGRKEALVVATEGARSTGGEELVQPGLVLDQALGARRLAEGPGRMSRDAPPREAARHRPTNRLVHEVEHESRVEAAGLQ